MCYDNNEPLWRACIKPIETLIEKFVEVVVKYWLIWIGIGQDYRCLIFLTSNHLVPQALPHLTRLRADCSSNKEQTQTHRWLVPRHKYTSRQCCKRQSGVVGFDTLDSTKAYFAEGEGCFSSSTELPCTTLDTILSDLAF